MAKGKKAASKDGGPAPNRERIEVDERDRFLFQAALEKWKPAVVGIANRAEGMGYDMEAARADVETIIGQDGEPGLLDRVLEQANLFEKTPDAMANVDVTEGEIRCLFFALRKYRGTVEDLRKDNRNRGYHTDEQDADLEKIGDPEKGDGWLGRFDRGWLPDDEGDGEEQGTLV